MIPPAPTADDDEPDPAAFRDELRALYDALDADIRAAGPSCAVSGRCCRFAEYGHTLFVSAPEFALLLAEAPSPSRPVDDGATCPWQDARGRCTAREARPLGCRVYFCDPSFRGRDHELSEAYLARLRVLVDRLGMPWRYAPLHRHLAAAVATGRLPAGGPTSSAEPVDVIGALVSEGSENIS